jgi:DNA-binding transcriptional LysR family regulator
MQPPGGVQSLEPVFFKEQGITGRVDLTAYRFNTIPSLVVNTDCIATVHGRLARQAEARLPIKILKLPFRLPRMRQAMPWHKSGPTRDAGALDRAPAATPCVSYCPSCALITSSTCLFTASRLNDAGACIGG